MLELCNVNEHVWADNPNEGGKICLRCRVTRGCTWPKCYCDYPCPDEWVNNRMVGMK